ncbi:MAG: Do family serine endopeptidase [Chthoniobacteraceae bacterium]
MKRMQMLKPLSLSIAVLLSAWPALAADDLEKKAPAVTVDPTPVAPKPGIVTTFAPIVEKVAPSVVTVSTSKMMTGNMRRQNPMLNDPMFRRFFGIPEPDENEEIVPAPKRKGARPEKPRKEMMGLGSGVIVSPEGHILTNNHVIDGADEIIVKLGKNSHEYKATKIGTDPDSDLAVLKIEGKDLPAITFADSEKVRVGDVVLAVGNPFGFTQSVTTGIVSALGRGMPELNLSFQNFIQTDASINPGNSGGALVDTDGRLIGVNTAIYSRTGGNQGIGFAVPGNLARDVMDGIIKNGRMIRGYLGLNLQEMSEDLAKEFKIEGDKGALVGGFPKDGNSPAQKAGIKEGDVVVAVDGKQVEGREDLIKIVSSKSPGTEVSVKLLRDGKETVVPVKLGERPSKNEVAKVEPADADPDVLDGVTVADIDADARKKFDIPENAKGVVVTQIDPDSACFAQGIRDGDVIHEINREVVASSKQAVELSEKVKMDKKVLLRVSSKGASRFIVIAPKE